MSSTPKELDPIKTCFYAAWFGIQEKKALRKSSPDGFDEVYNLRAFAGRITAHLFKKEPADYSDDDLKLLTTLVRISVGIGALLRGNFNMQARDGTTERSVAEAIQSMEDEWSQA